VYVLSRVGKRKLDSSKMFVEVSFQGEILASSSDSTRMSAERACAVKACKYVKKKVDEVANKLNLD